MRQYRKQLLQLARDQRRADSVRRAGARRARITASAFTIAPTSVSAKGEVVSWYDKIQLVPFGEYVPARGCLGYFVNRVVQGMGDMFPGKQQTLFDVNGAKLSVLICYESIFPDLARRSVKAGADVMVNITNDAWYGTSSAPYQLACDGGDAIGRNQSSDDSRRQHRHQRDHHR